MIGERAEYKNGKKLEGHKNEECISEGMIKDKVRCHSYGVAIDMYVIEEAHTGEIHIVNPYDLIRFINS